MIEISVSPAELVQLEGYYSRLSDRYPQHLKLRLFRLWRTVGEEWSKETGPDMHLRNANVLNNFQFSVE